MVEHAYYLASLQLMQLLWPLVITRQAGGYLDLEGGNRICMVLEWTLGLKRLAYSRIDLSLSVLQRQHVQKCRTSCVQFSAIHFIRTCSFGMGIYSCS